MLYIAPVLWEYFPMWLLVSSEQKKQLFLIPAFLSEIEFSGWAVTEAQANEWESAIDYFLRHIGSRTVDL